MFNIISYIIYLILTFYITIIVGLKVYRIGYIYLTNLIENINICQSINRLLLIGYYLVNLGFSAFCLTNWENIKNYAQLLTVISNKVGFILLILGILHALNLIIIYIASKKQIIKQ